MSDRFRADVVAAWTRLVDAGPVSAGRVSTTPVGLHRGGGDVLVGVEADSTRTLLVPISSRARLRTIQGPHLQLRSTPLEDSHSYAVYADLRCPEPSLWELFADLVAQILEALAADPSESLQPMYTVIDRWRALFAEARAPLGPEAARGLFGELLVLERLLRVEPSAHRLWTGPERAPRDFESETGAIEVKASIMTEGRRVRIHGLDQLADPRGGELALAWFRLRPVQPPLGRSLLEMSRSVLELCDDEVEVQRKLAAAGVGPGREARALAERYRFVEEENVWFCVDQSFPRLTHDLAAIPGAPLAVLDVEYTVDLSSHTSHWDETAIDAHVERLLDGAVR